MLARHSDYHYITERIFKGGFDDHWEITIDNVYDEDLALAAPTQHDMQHGDDEDDEESRFGIDSSEEDAAAATEETTAALWAECPGDGGRLLGQFEAVFWAGDLNYRLDTTRERADLRVKQAFSGSKNGSRNAVQVKSLRWLRRRDQLLKARRSEHVFKGYSEGELTFKPTFVRGAARIVHHEFVCNETDASPLGCRNWTRAPTTTTAARSSGCRHGPTGWVIALSSLRTYGV